MPSERDIRAAKRARTDSIDTIRHGWRITVEPSRSTPLPTADAPAVQPSLRSNLHPIRIPRRRPKPARLDPFPLLENVQWPHFNLNILIEEQYGTYNQPPPAEPEAPFATNNVLPMKVCSQWTYDDLREAYRIRSGQDEDEEPGVLRMYVKWDWGITDELSNTTDLSGSVDMKTVWELLRDRRCTKDRLVFETRRKM